MPAAKTPTVPVKKVQSFIKKEMKDLKADARRLEAFLSSLQAGPERVAGARAARASIKICDCCIKVE